MVPRFLVVLTCTKCNNPFSNARACAEILAGLAVFGSDVHYLSAHLLQFPKSKSCLRSQKIIWPCDLRRVLDGGASDAIPLSLFH